MKGEAAEIVSSLEISGANYVDAWLRLKERYDNKRLIMQNHIKAIFELAAVKKEEGIAIRQLLDGLLKHTRALRALDRLTEQWDDLLIHVITSKLDYRTLKEWESTIEADQIPSLNDLTGFLTKRSQVLEAVAKRNPSNANSRPVSHHKSVASHAATSGSKCGHCQGGHLIYQYKEFQGLPVVDRVKQIKAKDLCLNCLKGKHFARDCRVIAGYAVRDTTHCCMKTQIQAKTRRSSRIRKRQIQMIRKRRVALLVAIQEQRLLRIRYYFQRR